MQQVLETCDGLVLGTLDSQSLGLGLVLTYSTHLIHPFSARC